MFKADWEKINYNHVPEEIIRSMVNLSFPKQQLKDYSFVSQGCANINIRLELTNKPDFAILRIYQRSQQAASLEQQLAKYLPKDLLVPKVHSISEFAGFTYSIVEYVPGITLAEYLLQENNPSAFQIMFKVGQKLAEISSCKISDNSPVENLLSANTNHQSLLEFLYEVLDNPIVHKALE